jgi:hypothetical protein
MDADNAWHDAPFCRVFPSQTEKKQEKPSLFTLCSQYADIMKAETK